MTLLRLEDPTNLGLDNTSNNVQIFGHTTFNPMSDNKTPEQEKQLQTEIRESKKAYVTGFMNQALAMGYSEQDAESMCKKACNYLESRATESTREVLTKRASIIRESVLETAKELGHTAAPEKA